MRLKKPLSRLIDGFKRFFVPIFQSVKTGLKTSAKSLDKPAFFLYTEHGCD